MTDDTSFDVETFEDTPFTAPIDPNAAAPKVTGTGVVTSVKFYKSKWEPAVGKITYDQVAIALEYPYDSPDKHTLSAPDVRALDVNFKRFGYYGPADNSDLTDGQMLNLNINKRVFEEFLKATGTVFTKPSDLTQTEGKPVYFRTDNDNRDPSVLRYSGFRKPKQ